MPRKYEYPTTSALRPFAYGYPCSKEMCPPLPPTLNQPQVYEFIQKQNFNGCCFENPPQQVCIPQIPKNKKNNYPNPIPLSLITPKQKRQKFTQEEDEIIISLVGDNKYPNWNEIASHIKGKTGRQCRERFQHYLSPKLSRDPWTKQEDQLIISLYNRYGPNWALIAEHFNGKRTNNNIKNRFNNHIKFSSEVNHNLNISPQPPIITPYQPQIQQKINLENPDVKRSISSSPCEPSITFDTPQQTSTSSNEEVFEFSPFTTDDEFSPNQIDFIDFGKLENDGLCDFGQNVDNFDCFPDFLGN